MAEEIVPQVFNNPKFGALRVAKDESGEGQIYFINRFCGGTHD